MKLDEFAFVNQQLAGMLQSGIPLEGALRQLSQSMRRGKLRTELQLLEQDLARGTPLAEALPRRKLPAFYSEMLKVGVQSNNLPSVLTLLADYYQRANTTWTRLKGLMIYPTLVLVTSLALSILVATMYARFMANTGTMMAELGASREGIPTVIGLSITLWLPVVVLALATAGLLSALSIPPWRQKLRWHFPGFKEAGLSQLASALALMLQNGCSLNQALNLVRGLETGSPAEKEIQRWQSRLALGHTSMTQLAAGGKVIPPLFVWLVAGSGEDWPRGFRHAAEIYYARAMHRIEVLLYAVLPVSALALGLLILLQVVPMFRVFLTLMRLLGDMGDGGP